jgi:anhydro-N-acetylmuramic acid kinase
MRQPPQAPPRRALGCWSGPALAGIHAAVLDSDGTAIARFGPTAFRPWAPAELGVLQAARGCPDAAAAAAVVGAAHADLLARFEAVEVAGLHFPATAQEAAGGGPLPGVDTVWDFRSSDIALGGAGTPITAFFYWALARRMGTAPVAFLILGRLGRLIRADPAAPAPEVPGAVVAFETGPLCGALDDLARARTGQRFDAGGRLAARGQVRQDLVRQMLALPHFQRMPPKTFPPADFAPLAGTLDEATTEDALATLTACGVAAILSGLQHLPAPPAHLVIAGSGQKNTHLMSYLERVLQPRIARIDRLDLGSGTLQAQAAAWLALRVLAGLPTSGPGTTGVAAAVGGGRIARAGAAPG